MIGDGTVDPVQFPTSLLAAGCVVAEGGDEGGAGEGVAAPDDEAAGGRAVGSAGLGVAGGDAVGVARQPAWRGVPVFPSAQTVQFIRNRVGDIDLNICKNNRK